MTILDKYLMEYCEKCGSWFRVIYVYPNKDLMMQCEHVVYQKGAEDDKD